MGAACAAKAGQYVGKVGLALFVADTGRAGTVPNFGETEGHKTLREGTLRVSTLLCGVMVAFIPAQGFAQATPAGEPAEAAASPDNSGDIIVTAQRRAERLVDVPISVNSIGSDELEVKRIDSVFDLGKSVTSLRFEGQAPSFQPTLRGVGTLVQGGGVDASVAVYVDGVYLPNTFGLNFDLPNVENIQVLKGPQGTLFGRNATGGAILITTAQPSFEYTGRLRASYARFDDLRLQGYVSGPLSKNVAAGLSVNFRRTPGYTTNLANGADNEQRARMFNIRPDIRFSNQDNLNIRLIYEHSYAYDTTTLGLVNSDGYAVANFLGGRTSQKFGEIYSEIAPINRSRADSGTAIIDWDVGEHVALKSVTNYRKDSNLFFSDGDASDLPLLAVQSVSRFKTFSQEFTLSGKSDILDWVAGLYYFNSRAAEPDTLVTQFGVTQIIKSSQIRTRAMAAFGDVTFQPSPGLFLTAGGRFSSERKSLSLLPGGVGPEIADKDRWNSFAPRAVVRYELADNSNVYASYSRGFKSGAFAGFPPNKVDPEKADAFEVGFKHSSPTFSLNAAAFYYNYKDFQVTTFDFSTGQGVTLNAKKQRNMGAELEMTFRPVPAWRISLAGAYLDASFRDFPNATAQVQAAVPLPLGPGGALVSIPGFWVTMPMDASGTRTPRSPKWTGNMSTSYDIDVGSGTVQLAANVAASSSFFNMVNEQFKEPGYAEVGLNISYTTRDTHWRAEAFVSNLTDHKRRQQYQGGPFGTYAIFLPPRVFGGALTYSF